VDKNILKPKQQRFVEEYVIDWNGTQAAIRAGYSKTSAKVTASRLLTKANIKSAINTLRIEIRDACYSQAVEAAINDRLSLATLENSQLTSDSMNDHESGVQLPNNVEVKRTEDEDHEIIEIQFPNRM